MFSLTLDHCSGLDFLPHAATRLRHLRIFENNACDIFIHAVNHNPHFAQILEVLEIASTNPYDFSHYTPQDFRDCIRKCANLREFRVAAGYRDSLDTDLASYIPPPVEKLALRFTRSLPFLHDLDDWINYGSSDQTWLPRLKSFQLTIDPESCVGGLEGEVVRPWPREWMQKLENPPQELTPEAFDMEFEERRTALYDVLKSTRPSIDLFF